MGAITTAIGLMSGTSLDGVDAAIVRTDGLQTVEPGPFISRPYTDSLREALRGVLGSDGPKDALDEVEDKLTRAHAEVVKQLLEDNEISFGNIEVIGFHGQTTEHRPAEGMTRQIGNGALLAELTGRPVVNDFRSADVAADGEGAPFAPLYHAARAGPQKTTLAVLNIGGVANVTWLGATRSDAREIIAFDTGPGNALIDDWVRMCLGLAMDDGGRLASAGRADESVVCRYLDDPYFSRQPPKSLDRDAFPLEFVAGLSAEDGAATLTAVTAASVAAASRYFPEPAGRWLVTGGGRHNGAIMEALRQRLGVEVAPVEEVGWRGDALEAEAFAYLAVRSLKGLPLTLPSTTGCREPTTGGRLWQPRGI